MPTTLSPQEFVAKWRSAARREKANAQEHFIDLCHLVGHPTPVEQDPKGTTFTFEYGADKQTGGQGWADVYYQDHFGWEYKSGHADLDKAYAQLLLYREALRNPPLLIVSDMERIIIHPNFINSVNEPVMLALDDLLTPEGQNKFRAIFHDPKSFESARTPQAVTEEAAQEFARIAELLRNYGEEPHRVAHFLIRILFCLFAEDIGLLPNKLFSQTVKATWMKPADLTKQLRQLFTTMATGGFFGPYNVLYFNGGLFDDDFALSLDSESMEILQRVCDLDWSKIQPSILGTLFHRSLDPSLRAKLGAQYTSEADILLIVEPVLMAPLRARWNEVKKQAQELARRRDGAKGARQARLNNQLRDLLIGFAREVSTIQVLDPASGSGNFLYVALRLLLDLWKEISVTASELGLPLLLPDVNPCPSPSQMHGIEVNPYAHELASTTIWIGYIQWRRNNGFGDPPEPILKPIHNVVEMDAILRQENGKPIEPEWPNVDYIIGNPPFLGGKRLRTELGGEYVDDLFTVYAGRVTHEADLICYWFEKARAMIEAGRVKRVGLLATQAIRGGKNRLVLDRIKGTGEIFMAWSDRPWILEGAMVHVSMIGFDDGSEKLHVLNGVPVETINADLTASHDLTKTKPLPENFKIAFMGDTKVGPFDIDAQTAREMLRAKGNPNGHPNNDVIRRWVNGSDITGRPRNMWIVDFGTDTSEREAAQYEKPFEYIRKHVKPFRKKAKSGDATGVRWWLHQRPRPDMRAAIAPLSRYIITPRVSKHRLFAWMESDVLPDSATFVFAREDDYFFGVLHSKVHEIWARRKGTQLREAESGSRYTPTTTFETFPMPWPPGAEPTNDPRYKAIAEAAYELVGKRDRWLEAQGEGDFEPRTLTNLYNEYPKWLEDAHRKLNDAVLDAYGWPHDLSEDEIRAYLLALNLARSKIEQAREDES
jgi:type II restriction/modification system DNA methylase subunit YeeA